MHSENEPPKIDEATHLFRRQFLLGPKSYLPNANWNSHSIVPGLELSHHADLPALVSKRSSGVVGLIGIVVDPFRPAVTAEELLAEVKDPEDITPAYLADTTDRWTGRWCFLCVNDRQRFIIHDACGLRAIHYFNADGQIWCGSQPEIIRTQVDLTQDQEIIDYYKRLSERGIEPSLVGYRTKYERCYALLPNQRLDLQNGNAERFFPHEPLGPTIDTDEALGIAKQAIQGGLEAILRYADRISVPVTAGYETRTILAASRPFQERCDYFVDRKGVLGDDAADVRVPRYVCNKINVPFTAENSIIPADEDFMKTFLHNVSDARDIPKTMMIYRKFLENDQRININGNGSEVCRCLYDPWLRRTKQTFDDALIAKLMHCPPEPNNLKQIQEWLVDIQDAERKGYKCLDLAHWEQRMGRWGALFPAEQDIAVEEFSPFSNRYLIKTLLRVPPKLRCEPKYKFYRMIMNEFWPEVLCQPFNPLGFWKQLKYWSYKNLPDPLQEFLVVAKRSVLSIVRR